jgi:hypothetical protein
MNHMVALVEALRAGGNRPLHGGFRPNQGGWDCAMAGPVDEDLLRRLLGEDRYREKMRLRADVELTCLHCWSSIRAPVPE